MNKRKQAVWGVAALMLAAAPALSAAGASQGLSAVEIAACAAREERDLKSTEWGATFAEVAEVRQA